MLRSDLLDYCYNNRSSDLIFDKRLRIKYNPRDWLWFRNKLVIKPPRLTTREEREQWVNNLYKEMGDLNGSWSICVNTLYYGFDGIYSITVTFSRQDEMILFSLKWV